MLTQQAANLATTGFLTSTNTIVLFVAGALLAALVSVASLWARARRAQLAEVRRLVEAIETVRGGGDYIPIHQNPQSPLAIVGDALNRLGDDAAIRLGASESIEERLRAVMDAAEDTAVITTDVDGDVTSFSRGAAVLFGWDEDDMISRSAMILFQRDDYKNFLVKLTRRSLRDQGFSTRSTLVRQDGTTFPGSLAVRSLSGGTYQQPGFLMIVKDISEQVRVESELRESEARYRGLVDGLSEGVAIAQEGKLVFANGAFGRLYERPAESLVGKALHQLVSTRDVLLVEDRVAAVESGREIDEDAELRARLVDEDGLPLAQIAIKAARMDYAGRPAVLLLARDETVERRIEAELRHNEARLDAVIETMSDGLLVLSHDLTGGTVQMTNRAFADLVGLKVSSILGLSLPQLQAVLTGRGTGPAEIATLLGQQDDAPAGATVSIGDSPQRELEVRTAGLTDRTGGNLGRVLACRDMTARRHSEKELQAFAERLQLSKTELESAFTGLETMNRQLQTRSEDLDRLNSELHALNDMKTHLLGNVAHELQTPLVSVRGYTEMILKGRLGAITEEQNKGLTLALKNIDRLITMIDNLLSFSREQTEMGTLNLQRFSVSTLLDETHALLGPQIRARGIGYKKEDFADDREVYADRDKIAQVLTNLLSNAIKFNKERGTIRVSANVQDDDQLSIRIADTGTGIPRDQVERIFERSFRVESGPSAPEGSGIGLTIVRDILRQHGCRIYAESVLGEGTTFSFTLPLAPAAQRSGESSGEVSDQDASPASAEIDAPPKEALPGAEEPATSQEDVLPSSASSFQTIVEIESSETDDDGELPPRLRIIRNPKP